MHTVIFDQVLLWVKKYWIVGLGIFFELFIIGSLWTFHPTDSSWLYHATTVVPYHNIFGFLGAHSAAWMIYWFGSAVFLLPCLFFYMLYCYYGMSVAKKLSWTTEWDRAFAVIIGLLSMSTFCQLYDVATYDFTYAGGVVGWYLVHYSLMNFDLITQKIIIWMVLLICAILIMRCSYIPFFVRTWRLIEYAINPDNVPARLMIGLYQVCKIVVTYFFRYVQKTWYLLTGIVIVRLDRSIVEFEQEKNIDQDIHDVVYDFFWQDYMGTEDFQKAGSVAQTASYDQLLDDQEYQEDQHIVFEDQVVFDTAQEKKNVSIKQSNTEGFDNNSVLLQSKQRSSIVGSAIIKKDAAVTYALPMVQYKKNEQHQQQEKQEILAMQARLLEEKLEQFDIKGFVVAMHAGPVVTLFEYQPDIKVKVSRILALEDDLAMALKALSIRIIAPIPGRSVVGFEVSNQHRQDVVMSKILQSEEFKKYPGALPLIFGQDTLGNDVIADLAKMPHLLIAGSTGSGKSVALNAMLVSLLCSLRPDQLKLIIIDPKRLEFASYDGIAHLIFPIVTETKKAIPILKWVVQTMEKRYEIMAKYGVRNLLDYQLLAQRNSEMEPMPLIVVIIDELADLMMTAGKAVEDSIARIAQMARAAGIHMIIATQRPSVDVITGMIKVNFPNRVAFKVTSKIDSRTILDTAGAEKLLGRGDMLFLDASKSHLVRVHGAYISDQEIHEVVKQIKQQAKVQYLELSEQFETYQNDELLDGDDDLYQEIIDFIQDIDEVSISMLQRRFRIGYNRSARIVSMLESKGLIISTEGGKTRKVIK